MERASFEVFYHSDFQSVWLLAAVALTALVVLAVAGRSVASGAVPSRARFVQCFGWIFGVLILLDPIVAGPIARALGWSPGPAGLALVIVFVLLGDLRVFLLGIALADPALPVPRALVRAATWTLVVPLFALGATRVLQALAGTLPDNTIWLIYELAFFTLALWWRGSWVPRNARDPEARAVLRDVLLVPIAYYALWAGADLLVLLLGLDLGWALRVVPNLLYYGVFLLAVWFRFFSRTYVSASASAQAAR